MKRIAILLNGDLKDRKGFINAVIERAKRLYVCGTYNVEIFCLSQYDYWFIRQLRHTQKIDQPDTIEIDGLPINLIWYPFSLIDYILDAKFHIGKIVEPIIIKRMLSRFRHYDLVCAHSMVPGLLAYEINKQYHIPYCITWHGSDIHTEPFVNKEIFKSVSRLMSKASCNIFVSQALQQTAKQINPDIKSAILYNAASEKFYRMNDNYRETLRGQYKLTNDKVVAFAGGLVPVKNADILPDIFASIQNKINEKIEFWIIGAGKLRGIIATKLASMPNVHCKLWGNQPVEKMPELLNCVDILVLPSKNEGLPLIVVEALQSGANVVASDVGGIKEVLDEKNVIILGENFIERFSSRVVELLNTHSPAPKVPPQFDWQMTSNGENEIYTRILNEKEK